MASLEDIVSEMSAIVTNIASTTNPDGTPFKAMPVNAGMGSKVGRSGRDEVRVWAQSHEPFDTFGSPGIKQCVARMVVQLAHRPAGEDAVRRRRVSVDVDNVADIISNWTDWSGGINAVFFESASSTTDETTNWTTSDLVFRVVYIGAVAA